MDDYEHEGFTTVSRRMGRGSLFRPEEPDLKVSGTIERIVRQGADQRLSLRFITNAEEWKPFREAGPNRMSLEGETEMGKVQWRAAQVFSRSVWTPYQDHQIVDLHLPLLEEEEQWDVQNQERRTELSATFTRCAVLPAPPGFDSRPEKPLRPDAEEVDLIGDGSILVKTSYSMPLRVRGLPGLVTQDEGIAVWTLLGRDEATPPPSFEDFAGRMGTLATALSLLSAQHVGVMSVQVIDAAPGTIAIRRRLHHTAPPPKRLGTESVIGARQLHEYLPQVFAALTADGDVAPALRHAARQFASLASADFLDDQLRHGVVAMDILAQALGSWEECDKKVAKTYRKAMVEALEAAGAPEDLRAHTRNMLRGGFSKSFRKGIETMLERLAVPHEDLFPEGFQTLVNARNDLQHQGFVSADLDDWAEFPSKLGVLLARVMLRACGVPSGSRGVWASGVMATFPAG